MWVFAAAMLIFSGIFYRSVAVRLEIISDTPIELDNPLSSFPLEVGNWHGQDRQLSASVIKVAGNDDFLNRLYINERTGQWANIYVAYTARPGTMLGHRPQICYVGSGWVHDSSEKTHITSISGRKIDCLIHRFHKPPPDFGEVVVLNYYILNGTLTSEEDKFAGIGFRSPNIEGNAARYVAQIQVSSVVENSVRTAAADLADLIINFFPTKRESVKSNIVVQKD